MFRQKAQKLGLFDSPITPPEDRHTPHPQPHPQPVVALPQQPLSLLQRRQLRQQQLGLAPPPVSDDISKITPAASPLPNLAAIYTVDKSKTLGDTSQFKEAYKATKGDKNYVLFVFKKLNGSEPANKEIKIFEQLIKENKCEKYAICPVQVGLFEGSIAIVTEFIEGVTLADLIGFLLDKKIPKEISIPLVGGYQLSYLFALQLFEKIIKSLQFIHDTWKFVHLDLKPDNIMISNDLSSVYIIDLGSGCFSTEIVQENCTDRFAAEDFVAPESVFPQGNYWDFNINSTSTDGVDRRQDTLEQRRQQFENWKKADVYSIGKVFNYLLEKNVISFMCETQKAQLQKLIEKMTSDNYLNRPDSSQVFSELGNLKMSQCAGGISQLARCFF